MKRITSLLVLALGLSFAGGAYADAMPKHKTVKKKKKHTVHHVVKKTTTNTHTTVNHTPGGVAKTSGAPH